MNKRIEEIIGSISVNQGNFEHISHTGFINGSLLESLRTALKEAYLLALSDVEKKARELNKSIHNEIDELDDDDVDHETSQNNLRAESHGYGRVIYYIEELRKENI